MVKGQRRCTNGIAAFPDDLLIEVFSRVGNVKDLFRFAVTCRRWLRRFTDPAFLRQLCPGQGEGHRARLLGFFFQQTRFELPRGRTNRTLTMRMRMAQHTSVSAPSFLPAPGSPLGGTPTPTDHHRADLTSFVADDDGTFNYAEPLAARRGIVLMRLVPRTLDGLERMAITRARATSHLLGLCNPITGERHVLPPLESPGDLGRCDSYAIVTAADSDLDGEPQQTAGRRFEFSQLLLITVTTTETKSDAYLHSYSADTRSWSTPTMCLDGYRRFSMAGERSAVVHQGAAHWLCIDRPFPPREGDECLLYKLSAGVGATAATSPPHASLAKTPIRGAGSPHLFVSTDGKLSVACVYFLHVAVWTQQQGGNESGGGGDTPATWLRTAVMRIPMAGPNPGPLCEPCGSCTWLDFNGGSMLVLPPSGGVFVLDIEKKVVEKVMDCLLPQKFSSERNPLWDGTCVAYEMDLVEFFVRQLGGLYR
ncbi:hypothetical protein C2845_PM07G02170 [Panicum miliaceum]|uniref:Uncharacterized protein n=1 Tax=Panicum miliaceum TaxID=4540 RepID=A0A3L6SUH7_PANMI|nr:hypothetical protein C2845_PM07G02170 [Panicum miliaceum]